MAPPEGDAENQTIISNHEETPLLADAHNQQDHDSDHQELEDVPEQKRKQVSWYLWRVFWTIVAALILAAFIKGWIDAGSDVDVGFGPPSYPLTYCVANVKFYCSST